MPLAALPDVELSWRVAPELEPEQLAFPVSVAAPPDAVEPGRLVHPDNNIAATATAAADKPRNMSKLPAVRP